MVQMGEKMGGCIEWYDDTTSQIYNNWIRVKNNEGGCWSYLGQAVTSGPQDLNLGNGCVVGMIIEHEFLHVKVQQ